MTYTGRTHVGGPAAVRELAQVIVTKVAVGSMDNNAYLLRCRRTGAQVLIDAAADASTLLSVVGADGLAAVITTHSHRDHWTALSDVVGATGAETLAGVFDAGDIAVPTDLGVSDGEMLEWGDIRLEAIHLVGHTEGSIALLYDDPEGEPHLFSGDCLFPGGVGNTWGDPARFASLYEGLRTKVFDRLPDETWVYPGHGHDTTIGHERPHLGDWLQRGW